MKNNTKAIISSVLSRVAAEYNLNNIRQTARNSFKEHRTSNDELDSLTFTAIDNRLAYRIINLIDNTFDI